MSSRPSIAAVLASLLAAGCSLGSSGGRRADPGPPDAGVRVWAPDVVHWEPGHARYVEFAIENLTLRTLTIPAPDPANARVDVYAKPESVRLCGVEPRRGSASAATVALAPGDRVAVRVALDEACGDVPSGDYRYEVTYRFPDTGRSDVVAGTLPTSYGEVLVDAGSPPPALRRIRARDGRVEGR